MQLIRQALDDYATTHVNPPRSIALTPHAALTMACSGGRLTGNFQGIPVVCDLIDGGDAVPPGTGTRLGFFVRTNGVQQHVAVVELR